MRRVTTCLWFDREAEPAAQLYTSLIPNSHITAISRHGAGSPMPAGLAMTVAFELDGVPYQALNGGPIYKLSEACSISVACDTQAEIDRLWSALTADGGAESQCGWLRDRFGLSWQIVPSQMGAWMTGPNAGRVVAAFMPMKKLDLATLEGAARCEA
jgi:predicted 3-demethylubiquinone-9 3-methyltransferase (glyoxalase superfamily)